MIVDILGPPPAKGDGNPPESKGLQKKNSLCKMHEEILLEDKQIQ